MSDRRRERVARAIYPHFGSFFDFDENEAEYLRGAAFQAADAAIEALHGKTTAVTRFIGGLVAALVVGVFVTLVIVGVVVIVRALL